MALDDLYYRRVQQWQDAQRVWAVIAEGPVRAYGINCTLEGPSYCSIAPPYIFESWWKWSPHTYGTGGTWGHVGDRNNWST